MSKFKKIMLVLAKGGSSQADVARALHVSKRDVSAAAKALREHSLVYDDVCAMDAQAVDELLFPGRQADPESRYLQPDYSALVERN